jgi:HAD superfamily hydrolase (TIGR01509 family)
MDGTLTVPVHDFDAMRRELGLPSGVGTLEGLAALPQELQAERRRLLDEIGRRYVELARPQRGAAELLDALRFRGARLGLVTRNARANTLATLERIGFAGHFAPADVLTRDDGEPKPSPLPVQRLLAGWRASPPEAVIVGDAAYDLESGRAAGIATVLLDPTGDSRHRPLADHCVRGLPDLLGILS